MATTVSTKAPPSQPKMKRPPAPAAQSTSNGAPASSSPSPSLPTKRLPSGSKHPPGSSAANGVDGAASRISNRQRKESQKAAESSARKSKPGKESNADGELLDTIVATGPLEPQPYVKTTAYILKKFRGCPPSLIIHLHPTHFRFEQQDGSFGYNSPMKAILESIRSQTVPHDILEELLASNVRFYDGCLIVQIHDHRTKSTSAQVPASSAPDVEKTAPFSIHNYNEHLTPSPYVPYPSEKRDDKKADDSSAANGKTNAPASQEKSGDKEKNKENGPVDGEVMEAQTEVQVKQVKIFTTVLHATPLSLQTEMAIYASTPDPRASGNRRQSHQGYGGGAATPLTATMPPPTPSIVGPPTPSAATAPPAKRQKMLLDSKNFRDFESEVLRTTSSPLFLDGVSTFEDTQKLLKALRDPLHTSRPPPPKSRKRTVAELAADEALAAEEERFMLIMDERLAPASSSAANGGKSAVVDGGAGSTSFEPRFSRFKTIENIKIALAEKQRREAEAKAKQDALKRHQQAQAAAELQERRKKELEERARMQQHLAHQQQQHQQAQQQAQHSHPQMPNAHQQHLQRVTQGQHSSPVVRQQTPLNSSPMAGNAAINAPVAGVPMSVSPSNPGQGSPARPPSAAQMHPGMMANQMSRHPSQHSPSRAGTPQMGAASAMHQTPVMRHMTPTPHLSHASPVSGAMVNTPVMGQNMMMQQGVQLTPQQQHAMYLQRQAQLQQQANQGQQQLSPQQILQLQQRQQQMQNQQMNPEFQQYNVALNRQMQQQLQQIQQQGANGAMPNMHTNQNPRPQMTPQQVQNLRNMQYNRLMQQLGAQYGGQIPQHLVDQVRQRVAGMDPRQILQGQMMARLQAQQQAQQQAAAAAAQTQQNGQLMQPGQGMVAMQQAQGRTM